MTEETFQTDNAPTRVDNPESSAGNQIDGLQDLPAEAREILRSEPPETIGKIAKIVQGIQFEGPLPPPQILSGYADIFPDGPERIFSGWEIQYRHRQKLENRGQIFALVIALVAIGAAVLSAFFDHPWVSGVIVVSAMAAVGLSSLLNVFGKR